MKATLRNTLHELAYHFINGNEQAIERLQRKIEKHDTKEDNAHTRKRRDQDE